MENIIVVGIGDLYQRFLAPALSYMQNKETNLIATVDIKPKNSDEFFSEVSHRIRQFNEPLSSLLSDFKEKNPIVILAHVNDLHLRDTEDLVSNGFRVMLEKPYVVDFKQLESLRNLIEKNPKKIFLMEYYLTRKLAPLLLLLGVIKKDSFYLKTEEVFRRRETFGGLDLFSGKLKEILGDPLHLEISILESEGDSGKLEHRGDHVVDIRKGGGMLQDMGIHSLVPILLLEDYIGKIEQPIYPSAISGRGVCEEFYNFAREKYQIPKEFIGETYAKMTFITNKKIPIDISIGKYIKNSPTKKNVLIIGTKGKIDLDMHENFLTLRSWNEQFFDRIDLINTKQNRYYPVIKIGLDFFHDQNSLLIDLTKHQIASQQLILEILEKAKEISPNKLYSEGEHHNNILHN